MSRRPVAWLTWLLWALLVTLGVTIVAPHQVDWYVLTHPLDADVNTEWLSLALGRLVFVLAVPAYATVGAVVATLRPKNAVGWLCLVLSLLLVLVSTPPGVGVFGLPW